MSERLVFFNLFDVQGLTETAVAAISLAAAGAWHTIFGNVLSVTFIQSA